MKRGIKTINLERCPKCRSVGIETFDANNNICRRCKFVFPDNQKLK